MTTRSTAKQRFAARLTFRAPDAEIYRMTDVARREIARVCRGYSPKLSRDGITMVVRLQLRSESSAAAQALAAEVADQLRLCLDARQVTLLQIDIARPPLDA